LILSNRECIISYLEDGGTKYLKLSEVLENEWIYYEDGPQEMQ
jgi:hypothetical protein